MYLSESLTARFWEGAGGVGVRSNPLIDVSNAGNKNAGILHQTLGGVRNQPAREW